MTQVNSKSAKNSLKTIALAVLATTTIGRVAIAEGFPIPGDVGLPQICKYLPPHEAFGTVTVEKYNQTSVQVTGLQGISGPVILYYKGILRDDEQVHVFTGEDDFISPKIKLLPNGGNSAFFGDTWGYDVHCVVK